MKKFLKILFLQIIMAVSIIAAPGGILSPEEAFDVTMQKSGDVIAVNVGLGNNIYVYDEQIKISISKPLKVDLRADIELPEPILYEEEYMVHNKPFTLMIPLSLVKKHVESGEFSILFEYQGCSTAGICYQPMNLEKSFSLGGTSKVTSNDISTELSEQDQIAGMFKDKSIWLVLGAFFGFGVLLSLTPCIFPMIPILSSIIVSQSNESMNTKRAFTLSLVYVLAMSLAYTIAGILAGLFGANIQAALQNPWIISTFAGIFVLLAFSMFGFYEIQMPSFIQSKLTRKSDEMQGQGVLGVAVMGFLSALIVGPCVAAPLAGALIYIGQSGDALLGGAALFVMSIGMGLPLLLIGTGAGKFMPKPGGWMDNVKAVFGVVMLGLALWMLSRIVDGQIMMILWALLAVSSAVYLGALEPSGDNGWRKLAKSLGVILLIYGTILFIGAMAGSSNPLKPLKGFTGTSQQSTQASSVKSTMFEYIRSNKELDAAIAASSKPVMVDFYADWCISCIELENFTFSDQRVKDSLQASFTLLKIDVTKNSAEDKAMMKRFGIFGPPALLFFKDGKELKAKRIIGFKDADAFLSHINSL